MKTPIIAAILLTLAMSTTASAATIKAKDRKLAESLGQMYFLCHKYGWPEGEAENTKTAVCDVYDVLQEVLEAKGYCVVGQGAIGRPGGLIKWEQATQPGKRHCYMLTDWDKH